MKEFPDQKQRVAVCLSTFRRAKKKAAADKDGQSGENWEEAPLGSAEIKWEDVAADIEKTGTIKTENKLHLILPALPNLPNFVDPKLSGKTEPPPKKPATIKIHHDPKKD